MWRLLLQWDNYCITENLAKYRIFFDEDDKNRLEDDKKKENTKFNVSIDHNLCVYNIIGNMWIYENASKSWTLISSVVTYIKGQL